MTDADAPAVPLAFAASFPPEEGFAHIAAEIAARLASSAGCAEQAAADIGAAVDAAFREALAKDRPGRSTIELSLRTSGASFDADVTCASLSLLHCTRSLSA